VMLKAHHAVVDGIGGANLLMQLCGAEPDAPPPPPVSGAGGAYPLQIAASGLVRFALRPWRLATMLPGTASSLVQTLFRVREGRTMAAPFTAPTTAFNASLTGRRNIAYTRLDLGKIKVVKDRLGLTVNDVVFGLCAGVLRRFLLDRDALPDAPLVAASPVSVRDKTDRPGHNQTTWMFCRLETQISDPVERLRSIAAGNAAAKDHSTELGPNLLHNWTQFFNQTMFGTAMRILARIPLTPSPIYNLILSNVPGPQVRLYFLGCEVNGIYPLGPILGGAGLNITVMSLNGQLGVGIISCPDLLPDLWDIADLFPAALEELVQYTDPS
jgi:diacylglycerol O-acyltransferase / wax synthase